MLIIKGERRRNPPLFVMRMHDLHLFLYNLVFFTGQSARYPRFLSVIYDIYARFLRIYQVLRDYIRYTRRKRLLAEHSPPAHLTGRSV